MHSTNALGLGLLFLAALGAGIVNSMAGGGTLLTFPALLAAGVSPVAANATSAVALVPGSFSAGWAYRREIGTGGRGLLVLLVLSSVLGGFLGATLVAVAGDALFRRLVPGLIFGATALFILPEPLRRWRERRDRSGAAPRPDAWSLGAGSLSVLVAAHFLVSVYGGFFGAGMGILMLAELGFAGLTNIHQMNGLKSFGAVFINFTAAVAFSLGGHVSWPLAGLMAMGAILGGWGGSRLAQRLEQASVRNVVIAIGVVSGLVTLLR
jgi:uncharacterized membrane protein YfcA